MGLFDKSKGLAEQLQEATAKITALEAELTTAKADLIKSGELQAGIDAAQIETTRLATALKAESEKVDALTAENEALKKTLSNPPEAYQQANDGRKEAVADGGEAGKTETSIKQQYEAIKDPAERTAFYRKNRQELWKNQ